MSLPFQQWKPLLILEEDLDEGWREVGDGEAVRD